MPSILWRSSLRYLLRHPVLMGLSILGVALGVGVVVSMIGFRALSALVVAPDPPPVYLGAVDILLTGALLAGGSDGLHKLVEVYRNQMDKSAGNR